MTILTTSAVPAEHYTCANGEDRPSYPKPLKPGTIVRLDIDHPDIIEDALGEVLRHDDPDTVVALFPTRQANFREFTLRRDAVVRVRTWGKRIKFNPDTYSPIYATMHSDYHPVRRPDEVRVSRGIKWRDFEYMQARERRRSGIVIPNQTNSPETRDATHDGYIIRVKLSRIEGGEMWNEDGDSEWIPGGTALPGSLAYVVSVSCGDDNSALIAYVDELCKEVRLGFCAYDNLELVAEASPGAHPVV